MKYLAVQDWKKYQHYTNRNPPWFKLHKNIINKEKWILLPDAQKAALVSLFCWAAQEDNKIIADPKILQGKLGLCAKPDLNLLIEKEWLKDWEPADSYFPNKKPTKKEQIASNALEGCKQNATPENREQIQRTDTDTEIPTYPLTAETQPTSTTRAHRGVTETGKGATQRLFEMFWKAYPKKRSKGDAEKAFMKIKPDERLVATMIAKIRLAKTSVDWTKNAGQFIPHPASWLHAKGWEDDMTPGEPLGPGGDDGNELYGGVIDL